MNKKLFSWKALAGLALLVAMGLTSCKQDNAVTFDENGNYVVPTKPVTPTVSGTTVKAKLPSEITTLLASDDIKGKIKANEEANITIDCSALEVTAADATIAIPEVTDAIINVTLTGAPAKKEAALILKDPALDQVKLTLAAVNYGDIELDMPYTKLTIAGEGTINLLNIRNTSTTKNDRAVVLGGGTIKAIKVVSGKAYVNGATVEALERSTMSGYEAGGAYSNKITATGNFNWNGDYAHFPVIKVIKEAATPTLSIGQVNNSTVIDKVIVASDASVLFNYQPAVKEIEGELTAKSEVAAKIMFNDTDSYTTTSATIYNNWGSLNRTSKVSNVIIDTYEPGGNAVDNSYLTGVKALDNCTVNMKYTQFKSNATVNKIKFKATDGDIAYNVPTQGSDTSYTLAFESCEFATGTDIYINSYDTKELLDADGNQVKYTYYWYYELGHENDAAYYHEVKTYQEIPEAVRKDGSWDGPKTVTATEATSYSGFTVFESFKSCKYNDATLTKDNAASMLSSAATTNVTKRFIVEGVTYRLAWDATHGQNILVTAN
jgi:hypothetical protein